MIKTKIDGFFKKYCTENNCTCMKQEIWLYAVYQCKDVSVWVIDWMVQCTSILDGITDSLSPDWSVTWL